VQPLATPTPLDDLALAGAVQRDEKQQQNARAPIHAKKREPAEGPMQTRTPVTLKTPREPHVPPQATPRPVVPVSTPPAVPVAEANLRYTIEVFSRSHRIENGATFSFNDPVLGELGLGDLQAVVNAEGQPPARGRLQLEWSVDGIAVDSRPVALGRPVEYGNEPSAGLYRLTLTLHGRWLQTFSFRITP
jgi:hypothetical protein